MMKDLFKKARYVSVPMAKRVKNELNENPQDEELHFCSKCEKSSPQETFESLGKVCPLCGFHTRLRAMERLMQICDKNTFKEKYNNLQTLNPLELEGYVERIEKLKKTTGLNEAVLTGIAEIDGYKTALGIMDSTFLMASMGAVVGEKLTRLFEDATELSLPVVVFTVSGGARMQEGILSLMQMAKVSAAVAKHSEKGLLYITVVTDPTTGGVTASFASLGDIILAEPNAVIGFAGRRVIEDTIGHRLPENFQTSEFLLEHGFIDKVVHRKDLKKMLSTLFQLSNLKKEEKADDRK